KTDQAGMAQAIPGTGHLKIIHERPRAPGEHRTPVGSPSQNPEIAPSATNSWLQRLDQIQGLTHGRAAIAHTLRSAAFFVVSAPETINQGKLVIDLWSRDRFGSSEPGPLRPSRLQMHDISRFDDPQDQEILSLLSKTGEPKTFTPTSR